MALMADFAITTVALSIAVMISLYANKYQDILRSIRNLSQTSIIYMASPVDEGLKHEATIKYGVASLSSDVSLWDTYKSVTDAMITYRHGVMGDDFETRFRKPVDKSNEIKELELALSNAIKGHKFPVQAWCRCVWKYLLRKSD